MANLSYTGFDRITNDMQVTGSLSVDGTISELGYSIPELVEKMVVRAVGSDDSTSITVLNFITVTNNNGEVVVTS
jgi:hypothetical protein|tara:strand:+ start:3982 stop:4206 length:225 start_codon:yes stop_codon:yes gene_type:complete